MSEIRCPECNALVKGEYEAPYQEYPGAHVWGGQWYYECQCGWSELTSQDLSTYSIKENTKGW